MAAWIGAVVIGVCGGAAVALKLHGGFYLVPVALVYAVQYGWRHIVTMGVVGVITTLLPFALPQFSLSNFVSWFGAMTDKPSLLKHVTFMARYSLLYLVPAGVYLWLSYGSGKATWRRDLIYVGVFAACILALLYPGAKVGSSRYHYYYPFAPLAVDMVIMSWQRMRTTAQRRAVVGVTALLIVVSVVMSGATINRFYKQLNFKEADAVHAELMSIMSDYPGKTIQMGVGFDHKTYHWTWQKTHLVMAGNPYLIDMATMTETSFLGYPLTPETIDRINQCETDIWLIQKGEEPFSLIGYYQNKVFSDAFLTVFFAHHKKIETRSYFDLWQCDGR